MSIGQYADKAIAGRPVPFEIRQLIMDYMSDIDLHALGVRMYIDRPSGGLTMEFSRPLPSDTTDHLFIEKDIHVRITAKQLPDGLVSFELDRRPVPHRYISDYGYKAKFIYYPEDQAMPYKVVYENIPSITRMAIREYADIVLKIYLPFVHTFFRKEKVAYNNVNDRAFS